MSARCIGLVFERYPAGGGEFALALALADNAHEDGSHIYPKLETMASKSRQDVRSVQRHLRRMLAMGWLLLVRPAAGRGRPAEYRISPRWLKGDNLSPFSEEAPAPERDDKLSPFKPQKDDNLSPLYPEKRVTNEAEKGDKRSTPYKNQKNQIPPYPPAGGACGFETIAAGYPRRAGIDAARRDWDALAPDAQLQAEIARAIQAWIPSAEWQREGGRYVPKLGKFLRDQRWLDAPHATSAPPVPPPLPPAPELTPEQLRANAERAKQAAAHAREVFGKRALVPA